MKKLVGTFIVILLVLLGIFFSFTIVSAANQETSSSGTISEVNKLTNLRERLWEKFALFFKFSPRNKIDYQQQLTEKRLAELKYVIEVDRGDMIEETSSRYSTYLGNLTESVVRGKMIDKKQELLNMLDNHAKVLDDLIQKIDVDSGFWLLLKHDINYLKIYSDQIKSIN